MEKRSWQDRAVELEVITSQQYPIFTVKQYRLRHTLIKGGWSAWLARVYVKHRPVVVVLAYDVSKDHFVLLQQFRVGALGGAASPWLIETVAGVIDPGESVEQAAHRELEEETGLIAKQMLKLTSYWVSAGFSDEYAHIFLAHVDSARMRSSGGVEAEHEDIALSTVSRLAVYAALDSGQYNNSALLIALLWFRQHENELRNVVVSQP